MKIKDSCIIGMSNVDYHARPELSCSSVKTLLKNPYEFVAGIKKEPTISMDFGSAVLIMLLEPDDFDKEFAIMPKFDLRKTSDKEARVAFEAENQGKTYLTPEIYENALQCAEIGRQIAGRFFKDGIAEASFFSEIDGIGVRCRPDYYIESLGLVVDVKTTQDASPDGFIRSIASYGYHIQDAFYTDTLRSLNKPVNQFLFVAIETKPPYMVGLYTLDEVSRDFGRSEYQRGLNIYERLDEFDAPVYKDTLCPDTVVQTLTLPNYLYYKKGASI